MRVIWEQVCRIQGPIEPDYTPVNNSVRAVYNQLEESVLFEVEDGRDAMNIPRWAGHPEIPAEFCTSAAKAMVSLKEVVDVRRGLEDRVNQLEKFIGLNEVSRMETEAEAEKKKAEMTDEIPF